MAKKKSATSPKKSGGAGGRVGEESVSEASISLRNAEANSDTKISSNRIAICRFSGCHDVSTIDGFCRLHYLASWKKLKTKRAKDMGLGLPGYLKELSGRFPEEYFEKLRAEIEEMNSEAGSAEAEESAEPGNKFATDLESDEDMESLIKGIRIEDY